MGDVYEANVWMNLANRDEVVATHLYDTLVPMPVEVICFHCQQAVEKALKAILAYNEDHIPKTHDIVLLKKLCEKHVNEKLINHKMAGTITDFAVITRYAEDRRDFTEDTAKFALKQAKQTIENVKRVLNML